jgi:hypothetical protein
MRTASGTLAITASGKSLMGFLGRSNLTVSETSARFVSKAMPVLWRIAVPEIGSGVVKVWRSAKAGKPVDEFLRGMEKERGVKVRELERQPDENEENLPRETQASKNILKSINNYRGDVRSVAEVVEETKKLSESLIRMRLPDNMWGIKDVKKLIASVKSGMDDLNDSFDKFEIAIESTDRKADMALSLMRYAGAIKKESIDKTVTGLAKDFFTTKELISKMAQVLYPLFSIDGMFKKATGYPTTWAFDPSTFYDFKFNYDELIKGLVRLAKSEASVIEPMFIWKVQTNGRN